MSLNPLQILHKILFLLVGETQREETVVMVHHVEEGGEPAVVVEAPLLMRPESGHRRGAIHVRRRAVGLEGVDTDLTRRVEVVPRLREERRDMARRAPGRPLEQNLAAGKACRVERAGWRLGSGDRELIEMQRG